MRVALDIAAVLDKYQRISVAFHRLIFIKIHKLQKRPKQIIECFKKFQLLDPDFDERQMSGIGQESRKGNLHH